MMSINVEPAVLVSLQASLKGCSETSTKVCDHPVDPCLGALLLRGKGILAEVEVVSGIPSGLQTLEVVQLSCHMLHVLVNVLTKRELFDRYSFMKLFLITVLISYYIFCCDFMIFYDDLLNQHSIRQLIMYLYTTVQGHLE